MSLFTISLVESPAPTQQWYEVVFDTEKLKEIPSTELTNICADIADFTKGNLAIILTHKQPWATSLPVNAPSSTKDIKMAVLSLVKMIRYNEKLNKRQRDEYDHSEEAQ